MPLRSDLDGDETALWVHSDCCCFYAGVVPLQLALAIQTDDSGCFHDQRGIDGSPKNLRRSGKSLIAPIIAVAPFDPVVTSESVNHAKQGCDEPNNGLRTSWHQIMFSKLWWKNNEQTVRKRSAGVIKVGEDEAGRQGRAGLDRETIRPSL